MNAVKADIEAKFDGAKSSDYGFDELDVDRAKMGKHLLRRGPYHQFRCHLEFYCNLNLSYLLIAWRSFKTSVADQGFFSRRKIQGEVKIGLGRALTGEMV
jgi:hypothetical protein